MVTFLCLQTHTYKRSHDKQIRCQIKHHIESLIEDKINILAICTQVVQCMHYCFVRLPAMSNNTRISQNNYSIILRCSFAAPIEWIPGVGHKSWN